MKWDYSKFGPDFWPHLIGNHQCNGERQSPINIDISKTIYNKEFKSFYFYDYDKLIDWSFKQDATGGTKFLVFRNN